MLSFTPRKKEIPWVVRGDSPTDHLVRVSIRNTAEGPVRPVFVTSAPYLTLGPNALEIYQFFEPAGRDTARVSRPSDRGIMHISIVVENVDEAHAMLVSNGYQAYSSPVTLASGVKAVMVRDPDGIAVELFQASN